MSEYPNDSESKLQAKAGGVPVRSSSALPLIPSSALGPGFCGLERSPPFKPSELVSAPQMPSAPSPWVCARASLSTWGPPSLTPPLFFVTHFIFSWGSPFGSR